MKKPFKSYAPPNLGDGWKIASPADADININEEELKSVYRYVHDEDNLWQIRSLLVFRNGKLVAESYMKDDSDRTTPRAVWSCTKQVVGVLTGIALERESLDMKIDDPISKFFPQAPSDKKDITIKNLLMMKSGIDFRNDGDNDHPGQIMRGIPSDIPDFILGLGMRSKPGTQYVYKDGDPHLVSAIIQKRTGVTLRDWAKGVLFDEIGIIGSRLEWRTYKDGTTLGGMGIETTPRELAKIGQLVLNKGEWDGKQIVSETWINEMTSPLVPASEMYNNGMAFGYQWWKETTRDVDFMSGRGGQFVFINKDKKLMVVITSEPGTNGEYVLTPEEALSIYDRINIITKPITKPD